jgi:2-oxoisovalerate dehydrogenase E2 component (dihydrolipoyl transacylase)
MSTTISMPQLGESVAEGTIGKWLKNAGDRIERDEPLVEVMTDKVNTEIPSPVAGYVQRIIVAEGQTVPIGAELVVIGDNPAGEPVVSPAPPPAPAAPPVAPAAPTPTAANEFDEPDGQRRASPLVRRLATEYGIDLGHVRGSGLGGRISKQDILEFIEVRGLQPQPAARPSPPAPAASTPPPSAPVAPPEPAKPAAPPSSVGADEQLVPLTPMRRAIAEHMLRSLATAPHAWGMVEIDATSLVHLRRSHLDAWQAREGFELTYLPFFIKAVVDALRANPTLNARWTDQGVALNRRIHIGVAVALEHGLVVPVIRDADHKTVAGLAMSLREIVVKARSGRLAAEDLQGGTFTVNNTGTFGSIASSAIINQPQAGIITMEAIVKRPVVTADDAIAIRHMFNACLSFDHRVTDGAESLRFLAAVKRNVEACAPGQSIF